MENDYEENLAERVEQDKVEQKEKKKNKQFSEKVVDQAIDKSPVRFAPKALKGAVKDVAQTALTGKLLKGKSGWKKFLIVTAAIIVSFFGGLSILAKCFREEKFFTLKVIVFWIIVLIFLIAFIAMLFVLSTCESLPGFVNWLANKISGFDICPP